MENQIVNHNEVLIEEAEGVQFFKTSNIEQPKGLTLYLEEQMSNPYNKFCIDCKNNQTTHALIWLGIFVCKDCADQHKELFGGNNCYIKNVFREQWDDYQLRSIALGGNQNLFNITREYGIENQSLKQKYNHACITWFRKNHISKMDCLAFDQPKPPKDWEERIQLTQKALYNGLNENLNYIKANGAVAGQVLGEKTLVIKEKLQTYEVLKKFKDGGASASLQASQSAKILQDKIKSQQFTKNLFNMFGKVSLTQSQNKQQEQAKQDGEITQNSSSSLNQNEELKFDDVGELEGTNNL